MDQRQTPQRPDATYVEPGARVNSDAYNRPQSGRQDFWRSLEDELGMPPGYLEIQEARGGPQPPRRPDKDYPPTNGDPRDYRSRWESEHRGRYDNPNDYRSRWQYEHQGRGRSDNPNDYRDQWQYEHRGRYNSNMPEMPVGPQPYYNKDDYYDGRSRRNPNWQSGVYADGCHNNCNPQERVRQWQQAQRNGYDMRGSQNQFWGPANQGMYRDQWQWQNQGRYNDGFSNNPNNYRDQWNWQHQGRYNDSYYNNPNASRNQWNWQHQGRYNDGYYNNPNGYRDQWNWQHQGRYNDGYYNNPNASRDQWNWQHQGRYNDGYYNNPNGYRDQWQRQHQGRYNDGYYRNNNGGGYYDDRGYYNDRGSYNNRGYDDRGSYNDRGTYNNRSYDDRGYYDRRFENQSWQRMAGSVQRLSGRSVSQFDRSVPDNLGCARAVSLALEDAYGLPIREQGVENLESTIRRYGFQQVDPRDIQPGDVIIGKRYGNDYGHAALYVGDDQIFNNNSGARRMQVDSMNKFRARRNDGRPEFASVTIYRKTT